MWEDPMETNINMRPDQGEYWQKTAVSWLQLKFKEKKHKKKQLNYVTIKEYIK